MSQHPSLRAALALLVVVLIAGGTAIGVSAGSWEWPPFGNQSTDGAPPTPDPPAHDADDDVGGGGEGTSGDPRTTPVDVDLRLEHDGGGEESAIFDVSDLRPGDTYTRTARVSNVSDALVDLSLRVEGTGSLTPYLNLRVAVDGHEYDLPFDEPRAVRDAPTVALDPDASADYELTVELSSQTPGSAQDTHAGAALVWTGTVPPEDRTPPR